MKRFLNLFAAVVLVSGLAFSAEDEVIKANEELDRLTSTWPQQQRASLNKMLAHLPPLEREKYINQYIEGLREVERMDRESITVENVYARFSKSTASKKGLESHAFLHKLNFRLKRSED